ncbi:hypothetical protein [Pedobacter frigiditerrae]|uniref:hypothetical protein n=1 Tax=Pedobacter frigiditerrae TaxID=2530452 RepID=UPI00292F8FC8|nr:hypothetical protein [Pedobacter frigiditerrae]
MTLKNLKQKIPRQILIMFLGDFYVQCDSCTLCGAPEAEAPDLMEMGEFGCYFKKQPESEEETERAINALAVSCISAVRYRGTDKEILKKIIDLGGKDECDCFL